jgi:hypothetical protein
VRCSTSRNRRSNLAEAFDALATAEGHEPLAVAEEWFHDRPVQEAPDLESSTRDLPRRDSASETTGARDWSPGRGRSGSVDEPGAAV